MSKWYKRLYKRDIKLLTHMEIKIVKALFANYRIVSTKTRKSYTQFILCINYC